MDYVKLLAKTFPLVAILGPRQSGKTTLARKAFPLKSYVSLEDPDIYDFVQSDPRGFLTRFEQGAIIDEAQRAPQLFSYLQTQIDFNKVNGKYIITGSDSLNLYSKVTQSLAGRSAILHLLPLSFEELKATKFNRFSINAMLFNGMYPSIYSEKVDPQIWIQNYISTYLERDVRQLLNVKDLRSFGHFLRLCAGRTGQILNLSSLAADLGHNHNTIKSWISVLEASSIIFLLEPYYNNFNKRVLKSPKLYFYDTGLVTSLLRIRKKSQLELNPLRGAIFETYVVSEIAKFFANRGIPQNFYFWRDKSGLEVDLLIDNGDQLTPIEIKSGLTVTSDFFKNLDAFQKLAPKLTGLPSLIYGGNESYAREHYQIISFADIGLYLNRLQL